MDINSVEDVSRELERGRFDAIEAVVEEVKAREVRCSCHFSTKTIRSNSGGARAFVVRIVQCILHRGPLDDDERAARRLEEKINAELERRFGPA